MTQRNTIKLGGHFPKDWLAKTNGSKFLKYYEKWHPEVVQIFVSNPRSVVARPNFIQKDIDTINEVRCKTGIKLFIHAPYPINLSYVPSKKIVNDPQDPASALIEQIKYGFKIGALGVVIHCGRSLDIAKGITAMSKVLRYVCKYIESRSKNKNTICRILLETTAGSRREIGADIKILAEIVEPFKDLWKLYGGFVIDTAHIFTATVNLCDKQETKNFLKNVKSLLGTRSIKLIHFNDSAEQYMSNKDRHQIIGEGYIGSICLDGLKLLAFWAERHKIPLVLETPGKEENYPEQFKEIRKWKTPTRS